MSYLFSSESVSEGHPDKVADQISDAILDQFLAYDPYARVACESFVTTGQVVIMGEVRSEVYIDLQTIARNTIKRIGYTKAEYQFDGNSCGMRWRPGYDVRLCHQRDGEPDARQS